MFYFKIINKILRHCHSWLARQYISPGSNVSLYKLLYGTPEAFSFMVWASEPSSEHPLHSSGHTVLNYALYCSCHDIS